MPLIRVELFEGRTPEQKRALAQALTETTCRVLGTKPEGDHRLPIERKAEA